MSFLFKRFKFELDIISVYNKQKNKFNKLNHSVMQKELVTVLKSVAVVVAGVLVANFIEKKILSKNTSMPVEAPVATITK